jgi:hypothetical protein
VSFVCSMNVQMGEVRASAQSSHINTHITSELEQNMYSEFRKRVTAVDEPSVGMCSICAFAYGGIQILSHLLFRKRCNVSYISSHDWNRNKKRAPNPQCVICPITYCITFAFRYCTISRSAVPLSKKLKTTHKLPSIPHAK